MHLVCLWSGVLHRETHRWRNNNNNSSRWRHIRLHQCDNLRTFLYVTATAPPFNSFSQVYLRIVYPCPWKVQEQKTDKPVKVLVVSNCCKIDLFAGVLRLLSRRMCTTRTLQHWRSRHLLGTFSHLWRHHVQIPHHSISGLASVPHIPLDFVSVTRILPDLVSGRAFVYVCDVLHFLYARPSTISFDVCRWRRTTCRDVTVRHVTWLWWAHTSYRKFKPVTWWWRHKRCNQGCCKCSKDGKPESVLCVFCWRLPRLVRSVSSVYLQKLVVLQKFVMHLLAFSSMIYLQQCFDFYLLGSS